MRCSDGPTIGPADHWLAARAKLPVLTRQAVIVEQDRQRRPEIVVTDNGRPAPVPKGSPIIHVMRSGLRHRLPGQYAGRK